MGAIGLDAVLTIGEGERENRVGRSGEDASLIALVDGRRTVAEILRVSRLSGSVAMRRLRALSERRVVRPLASRASTAPGRAPAARMGVTQDMSAAADAFAQMAAAPAEARRPPQAAPARPTTQPMIANLPPEPAPGRPAAQAAAPRPAVQPTPVRPAAQPVAARPAAQAAPTRPAAQAAASRPAAQVAAPRPVAQPARATIQAVQVLPTTIVEVDEDLLEYHRSPATPPPVVQAPAPRPTARASQPQASAPQARVSSFQVYTRPSQPQLQALQQLPPVPPRPQAPQPQAPAPQPKTPPGPPASDTPERALVPYTPADGVPAIQQPASAFGPGSRCVLPLSALESQVQEVWIALNRRDWATLALIPAHPSGTTMPLASALVEHGNSYSETPILLLSAEGRSVDPQEWIFPRQPRDPSSSPNARRAAEQRRVLALDHLSTNPDSLAIAQGADLVLMVVETGVAEMASARRLVETIGRSRFVGCVMVPAE
jgi:hypothetical protein